MKSKTKISVIVATYNWPAALNLVLNSLKAQTDTNFEVVVADDGSTPSTKAVVDRHRLDFPVPLSHVWQQDLGFRVAAARNLGLRNASGEYVIFLDGDCIVRPSFVARHRELAEKGYFLKIPP